MEDFNLFTSLRYDPLLQSAFHNPSFPHSAYNHSYRSPFYMLDFHRDRILRAAHHWSWAPAIALLSGPTGLAALSSFILADIHAAAKDHQPQAVRLIVAPDGSLSTVLRDVPPAALEDLYPRIPAAPPPSAAPSRCWTAFVDSEITPDTPFTHYKTTKRDMYNAARERRALVIGDDREVLLVNPRGEIMEGSTTTPFFWRGDKWVTPPIPSEYGGGKGSGGQDGTSRRWALEYGFAVEEIVPADSITDGEVIWLSNGVRGFFQAKIKRSD
ncbi:hypothetical protein TD95_003862 [Thielaviopsis punctulata]|uniref:Aminodeoxychorismate lyase n=1 Tax=Thielaviopsis punctulata TaxID=72032 RepID=A0A0F4ZGQ3_9PEZI|nr:hypothetical protein TD95_003862 [Thielaviopsis punctulata]